MGSRLPAESLLEAQVGTSSLPHSLHVLLPTEPTSHTPDHDGELQWPWKHDHWSIKRQEGPGVTTMDWGQPSSPGPERGARASVPRCRTVSTMAAEPYLSELPLH